MLELLENMVKRSGEENVVPLCSAAHCVDLILEDIGELSYSTIRLRIKEFWREMKLEKSFSADYFLI